MDVTGIASSTDADTTSGTDTLGETDTGGGTLWCVDADGDGFGDPDMCQQSDEPVPGSVDNDDDCDDGNESTFPGAAELDDPRACMQDVDDDGYGDDGYGEPLSPGVVPGSDCLDSDPSIRPGAAEQEPDLCAEDNDDDGWGDTNPPPGVDPGSDCDDGNVYTYPGAAPLDDPFACMKDEDDDDFGDDGTGDPLPPGVVPGTDCDDTNPDVRPGAAPLETPPDLCTIDSDVDGWGDANPGPGGGGGGSGPQSGSDCYDTNPAINPDTLQLTALLPYNAGPAAPRTLQLISDVNAAITSFITLTTPLGLIPNFNLVTATFNEDLEIYSSDLYGSQLVTIDYELTCGGGTGVTAPVGVPYGIPGAAIVCGLEFGDSGNLHGISHDLDQLLTFDTLTGGIANAVPILLADGSFVDIFSCGTARDCTEGRLLVANGIDQVIYAVDELTGTAEVVRDLTPYLGAGTWTPVGLEYDPITRTALLSTGNALYRVDLVNDVAPVLIGGFEGAVSNLQYLPICGP